MENVQTIALRDGVRVIAQTRINDEEEPVSIRLLFSFWRTTVSLATGGLIWMAVPYAEVLAGPTDSQPTPHGAFKVLTQNDSRPATFVAASDLDSELSPLPRTYTTPIVAAGPTETAPTGEVPPGLPVPTGTWGGQHIRLVLTTQGGNIEYDCAFGAITGPLLYDQAGRFSAKGIHIFDRGGPAIAGSAPPKRYPANYHGWTDGSAMQVTVTLDETGKDVGTFSLTLGGAPLLDKCL